MDAPLNEPEEYQMTSGPGRELAQTAQRSSDAKMRPYLSSFPMTSALENDDQIRRFELLRLAFFVLKLRKLEQHLSSISQEECLENELKDQSELRSEEHTSELQSRQYLV